jgi:hypothetical protein
MSTVNDVPPQGAGGEASTPHVGNSGGTQARIDFRLNVGCVDHLKIMRLCGQFGDAAFLWLVRLWTYAAENRAHGRLTNMDEADIATVCKTDTDAKAWVEALVRFRLLDRVDEEFQIHDWADHQPWIVGAPERRARAREAALAKHRRGRSRKAADGSVLDAHATHAAALPLSSPPPVPPPSPRLHPSPTPEQNPLTPPTRRPAPEASRLPAPDLAGGPPFAPRPPAMPASEVVGEEEGEWDGDPEGTA